jgi:hypothetical protein
MSTSLLLVSAFGWVAQTLAEGEGEVAAVGEVVAVGEAAAEGEAGTPKVEYAQYIIIAFVAVLLLLTLNAKKRTPPKKAPAK